MRLSEMKMGSKGRVVKMLGGDPVYRQRLISLGLLPGTEFVVGHRAPLGDPMTIHMRGFLLSLRKEEAAILEIESLL